MNEGMRCKPTIQPVMAPIPVQTRSPNAMVIGRIAGLPKPKIGGRKRVCRTAMMAMTAMMASIEPTDKSILRETITKTMPVAMMPTDTVCTATLKILRGVMNLPLVAI